MKKLIGALLCASLTGSYAAAQTQPVALRFKAMVGTEDFACGRTYKDIGTTRSTIRPKDFRVYISDVRLLDESGKAVPVQLNQDDKWQLDNLALIDFEDGQGACGNGTPDTNTVISGTAPTGHYTGVRFTVGVPFEKNHTDLTAMPSPLNLTAMAWVWNAGRKFMRVEFASTGKPRGYVLHLGSTGCTPSTTKTTVPTSCLHPNRPEIELRDFDLSRDRVVVDLAALVRDSDVDMVDNPKGGGCMSNPNDAECAPLFANLGLALKGGETVHQVVFRKEPAQPTSARK